MRNPSGPEVLVWLLVLFVACALAWALVHFGRQAL